MKSLILTASAIALATPAFAQTVTAPVAAPAVAAQQSTTATVAVPAAPAMPQAATSSSASVTTPQADGSATTTTTTTTAPVAQAAPVAAPQTPEQILTAEFPSYDKDGNAQLSRVEFDAWMVALQEKGGQKLTDAQRTAWLKASFTKADKDKSKGVSVAELTGFLTAKQG